MIFPVDSAGLVRRTSPLEGTGFEPSRSPRAEIEDGLISPLQRRGL